MRGKNNGETKTDEDHKLFFSGREDTLGEGESFLINKDCDCGDGLRASVQQTHPYSLKG